MFKPFRVSIAPISCDDISDTTPCVNLGTSITNQMYNGVDNNNSSLLHGEFDDEDNWDVDPLCDMSSDRMELTPIERVPDMNNDPSTSAPPVE